VSGSVQLDPASIEALARRVAELLSDDEAGGDLVDAAELARRFSVSRDYVYEHADELGAVRLGNGSRARLRFNLMTVRERLIQSPVQDHREPQRENRPPVRRRGSGDLLPVKGE
jgi:hypothetical protein